MQYTADNILIKPGAFPDDPDMILSITPQQAGWEYISFQARRLTASQSWSFQSGENELVIVNLSGCYSVNSNRGSWSEIGSRKDVFEGAAHALYLPRHSEFTITAEQAGEYAVTWVPTEQDHEPWLIKPEDVDIAVRGGDNVSRQINDLLPSDSPVHRLVLVEVYTPSGNWSSYPPHKHDVHLEDDKGNLLEADLEEVYFYKIDKPEGMPISGYIRAKPRRFTKRVVPLTPWFGRKITVLFWSPKVIIPWSVRPDIRPTT